MTDIKISYTKRGKGFPLILLHGNGESKECFSAQIEELSRYFAVYALDTRGHGETDRGTAPFTIRTFANDLNDFMAQNGIKKAHILGFSDGANIAMVFAAKYPERIDKLVLNGGNTTPSGVKRQYQAEIEEEYETLLSDKAVSKMSDNALSGSTVNTPRKATTSELLELMINQPDITTEELQKIEADTLVIVGTDDMIDPLHTEYIAKTVRHSTLKTLSGDHFIAYNSPKAFNAEVLKFLMK